MNNKIFSEDLFTRMPQYVRCCDEVFTAETKPGSLRLFHQFELECWNDDIYMEVLDKVGYLKEFKDKYNRDFDMSKEGNYFCLYVNILENQDMELLIDDQDDYDKILPVADQEEKAFLMDMCEAYAKAETGKNLTELFQEYKEEENLT